MTDVNQPRTMSTAIAAIPVANAAAQAGLTEDEARARIAELEREARALGADPKAALLFHEIGLLWESPLKHPRNAAVAFQAAFKLAPGFVANIRAARGLFAEVGNWVMVVQLLDAELKAATERRARAALLLEKGQVLEQRLSKEPEAAAAYADCLANDPQDITLLIQLEQLFSEKQDHASLVSVQLLLAKVVTDDAARAHYFTSAGLILEDRLKKLPEAGACFREAFKLDRRDPLLLAAIKRFAQREGAVEEELAALAAEAESQGAHAAPTFLQISKAYERLGRPEDALAALLAARKVAPKDPLVLSELARIFETTQRYEELADVLLSWVNAIDDQQESIALNLRIAALYEEHLKRDADAVVRYAAIIERVPGHQAALAGLGKLYHRAQNWNGLLMTYESEAASLDDNKQKAARLYKSGEVLEERLQLVDEAIARYGECLKLSPGYLPAQKALIRLYERHGKWADLVQMYEQDLMQTADRNEQIDTLNRIAQIQEDRLNDVKGAIDVLKRVLEIQADHPQAIRNLVRLHERAQNWEELLRLLELEANLSGDTRHVVSVGHRCAEIIEEHLKDRQGAITAWERVLQLSPTYPPGLKALGRLYAQDGKWEQLIQMYRTEAEIAPSTEQAAQLVYKIGELFEQRLKRDDDAITAYQEVLTLAPSYFSAVRALARIYRAQSAWESLIDILRAEAANRSDPTERANAMFQAAAIWDDQLKKPEKAIEGYQEVLRLAPNHAAALQQLERLLTQRDDVKELVVLLDRQTQAGTEAARAAAQLKLARLYIDRLNEPSRAAQCAEAALQLEPGNLPALKLLERIKSGDRTRRTELRLQIAERMGDPKLAAAMRLASGDAADPKIVEQLKNAAAADPSDETLSLTLERALIKADDAAGLVELYERRRTQATNPQDALQLALRIGELCEKRVGDLAKAAQAYESALDSAPGLYAAQLGLARVFARMQQPVRARQTLEQIGQTALDPATQIDALVQAARMARASNDSETALALYKKVLERNALHDEAGAGLEDLLASKGGAAELAQLSEKRGEAKLAQRDNAAAARELFNAAKLYLEPLNDQDRASQLLERVLMAQPSHPEALELKGDLALGQQNWAEAAAAWSVRVQQGGAAAQLAKLHMKLGSLYQDQLGDSARAAGHLQTVVSTEPGNLDALERLSQIHTLTKNWTGAADCLRQLLEHEKAPQARARHLLALAKIYDEGFADAAQAAGTYKEALALLPGDRNTIDRLVELYERLNNLPELVAVLEAQAQQQTDVQRVVSLRLRIAELHARSLGNVPKAVSTWRSVLELDPNNVPAHVALAEMYQRDTASTAMAVEMHRALLRMDPTRIDSLHALFSLWESIRQLDKAFCVVGVLNFFHAATEVETAFYNELKVRLPNDLPQRLGPPDIVTLHHPNARNVWVDVMRAIGDQFVKLYPPQFEQFGIDRKADRLKNDHAVFKAVRTVTDVFGVEEFEVYQAKRGMVFNETTEPLSVCVGQDVVRRFNVREQRFLIGRAALGLYDKTAVLRRLSAGETSDLLGNSVRIHQPKFEGVGRRNDDQSKALRKAYSRRSLKLLEEPALTVASGPVPDVNSTIEALALSGDRAGLLFGADVATGLSLLLHEDQPVGTTRLENYDAVAKMLNTRRDVRELLQFALSDDFFRLRQRMGLALG